MDLFRFIEHNFAVPEATEALSVQNASDFQAELDRATRVDEPATGVRQVADDFLKKACPTPTSDPLALGPKYVEFRAAVRSLQTTNTSTVKASALSSFGIDAADVIASGEFVADKDLLQNILLAVKITTGFDRTDAARFVRALQIVELLEALASSAPPEFDRDTVDAFLSRPVLIPVKFLLAPEASSDDLPHESERRP
ncbi:MAG: hypothetical protein QOG30_2817, partial [Acidimicrobiaceae bacterium]